MGRRLIKSQKFLDRYAPDYNINPVDLFIVTIRIFSFSNSFNSKILTHWNVNKPH